MNWQADAGAAWAANTGACGDAWGATAATGERSASFLEPPAKRVRASGAAHANPSIEACNDGIDWSLGWSGASSSTGGGDGLGSASSWQQPGLEWSAHQQPQQQVQQQLMQQRWQQQAQTQAASNWRNPVAFKHTHSSLPPGVVPTGTQAWAEQEEGSASRARYYGRVTRFNGDRVVGHGFISCAEIRSRFGYDVYVHAKQLHGCDVGDDVCFTIVRNAKGEPQARSVVRQKDAPKFIEKQQRLLERQQEMLHAKRGAGTVSWVSAVMAAAAGPTGAAGGGGVMDEEQAKAFQKALREGRA